MQRNATKAKLLRGELAFGLLISSPDPMQVELAAEAGMDFVRLDCEHGPMTLETVENMVRAAEASHVTPIVRIPATRPEVVLGYMDRGVAGLVFPHVSTTEEACAAVRYMKFAPLGDRGATGRSGLVRWAFGIREPDPYEFANRETMAICLIEDLEGFNNIEKIAELPGVDAVMVGPTDLAQSMGHIKDKDHEDVRRVVAAGVRGVRRVGKPVGVSVSSPTDATRAKEYLGMGITMFHVVAGPLLVWAMKDLVTRIKS